MHNNMSMVIDKIRTSFSKQVNLFKKGLGVGVPGNQHDNTYAQRKIQRQILVLANYNFFSDITAKSACYRIGM